MRAIVIQNVNRCPNLIIATEHWIDAYACRCGDPDYPLMVERGYVWDEDEGCWTRPDAQSA